MPATAVSESLFRLGLNEVLPISEEATTSRVVVNNDVLRTVIFTFDAGQMLTEHASPYRSPHPASPIRRCGAAQAAYLRARRKHTSMLVRPSL